MKKTAVWLTILVAFSGACTSYTTTTELASRLGGHVETREGPDRATVVGSGHEIHVQSGTSVVIIDDEAVILGTPSRAEHGVIKVSDKIYRYLPPTGVEASPVEPVAPVTPVKPVQPAQLAYRVKHIVVDPGHGGRELGASYGGLHEKTVNLDIARKLAFLLRRSGLEVTLTRSRDALVTLDERSRISNRAEADLFISVHANAAANRSAQGVEIFYLAEEFTHASRRYDDTSRAAELNRRNHYGSGGVESAAHMSPSLLAQRRGESRELAKHLERAMTRRLGVPSRGLKQAGFSVLKWTCSPAVLVEVGFLSNPAEWAQLVKAGYRTRVAEALAEGILSYREQVGTGQ